MINPLVNLPYNTKRVYVVGTTHEGCEIYMPVDSFEEHVIDRKKDQLQRWLDNQPKTINPVFPGPKVA